MDGAFSKRTFVLVTASAVLQNKLKKMFTLGYLQVQNYGGCVENPAFKGGQAVIFRSRHQRFGTVVSSIWCKRWQKNSKHCCISCQMSRWGHLPGHSCLVGYEQNIACNREQKFQEGFDRIPGPGSENSERDTRLQVRLFYNHMNITPTSNPSFLKSVTLNCRNPWALFDVGDGTGSVVESKAIARNSNRLAFWSCNKTWINQKASDIAAATDGMVPSYTEIRCAPALSGFVTKSKQMMSQICKLHQNTHSVEGLSLGRYKSSTFWY